MKNGQRLDTEELLFSLKGPGDSLALRQRLAADLGLIEESRRNAMGTAWGRLEGASALVRRLRALLRPLAYQSRAKAAHRLGMIHHHESWPILVKALNDPSGEVQTVAVQSLRVLREPQSFPYLLERLRAAAHGAAGVSERELKTTLAGFPLEHASFLAPLLQDPHPRLRADAACVLRDMLGTLEASRKNAPCPPAELGPELHFLILHRLPFDLDSDVRAAAADLAGYVSPAEALPVIFRLMDAPEWFVRLHAVRAAARQRQHALMPALHTRLTDAHWRVREAAAYAFIENGSSGVRELLIVLLRAEDVYVREQIVEALELSGTMQKIAERAAEPGRTLERQAFELITGLGGARFLRPQSEKPPSISRTMPA